MGFLEEMKLIWSAGYCSVDEMRTYMIAPDATLQTHAYVVVLSYYRRRRMSSNSSFALTQFNKTVRLNKPRSGLIQMLQDSWIALQGTYQEVLSECAVLMTGNSQDQLEFGIPRAFKPYAGSISQTISDFPSAQMLYIKYP